MAGWYDGCAKRAERIPGRRAGESMREVQDAADGRRRVDDMGHR